MRIRPTLFSDAVILFGFVIAALCFEATATKPQTVGKDKGKVLSLVPLLHRLRSGVSLPIVSLFLQFDLARGIFLFPAKKKVDTTR